MINQFTELSGEWIYRSFRNITVPAQTLNDILFGEGALSISVGEDGFLQKSELSFGPGYSMIVNGQAIIVSDNVFSFPPIAIEMKAFGIEGTDAAGWLYEYRGYLVPNWYNRKEQKTAIVGTVIRVVAHGANSPAGYVASFVAVKK